MPENHTFYAAVMDCASKGIASGYAGGTFKPADSVTRAQFCVMLSRAFYLDEVNALSTKDNKAVAWFYPNVLALQNAGALNDVAFAPFISNSNVMNLEITRYQMAQLMTNIMTAKGFSATDAQKNEAQLNIRDYGSIPATFQDAVIIVKPWHDDECEMWRWNTTDATDDQRTVPYYIDWGGSSGMFDDGASLPVDFWTRYPA